jgi:hypothetical protein
MVLASDVHSGRHNQWRNLMLIEDNSPQDAAETSTPNWGEDAPRGGKAVMNRVLKEKATVPLFFAQTLIQSLRDVGYNHTTSALCEHVDNAIQAGANEIRVYFRQSGKKGDYEIDTAVYDNGSGMAPNVLKVATAFGGSMSYGNRTGIARFGMGMKTASLSMAPAVEIYSWQESGAIYSMTLDVEAIGKDRSNLVELPDPTLQSELPDEVADILRKPMVYPTGRDEQELLVEAGVSVPEQLGTSGTLVYMPQCDRLTYRTARTLVDHAVKEMARVYRRHIERGVKLYVNNRRIEAFDPTYSMPNARHVRFLEEISAKTSRLIIAKPVEIPQKENSAEKATVTIRLYRLPIEEWSVLPRKTLRNELRVFDGLIVSMLRNDREVFAGPMPKITTRHSVTNWYRLQIDFPGALDEAFGVAANKQGVRLKGYVEDAIKNAIGGEITSINDELKRVQGAQAASRIPAQPTASEAKASYADPLLTTPLSAATSPEEEAQLDANLRGLALSLQRDGESEQDAFDRIKSSKYIIEFKHDDYWPFYDVKHRFGRVILTINTAHPFFTELYDPVRKMGTQPPVEDSEEGNPEPIDQGAGPTFALDLLLLSLARTQGRLASASEDAHKVLEMMRREWSETYRVQLTA